jgi:hypothetical protein
MRNSVVGDAWIREMCQINPVQHVLNDKGEKTGNILSGPVRLAFVETLLVAGPQMKSKPDSPLKHSATIMFTPFVDLTIFWEEYYRIAASDFADHYNKEYNQYAGLDNPIYDQGAKLKYDGFTPGCMAVNSSSNYKPPVVDIRNNPIVDPSKVYAGVWAIVSLNAYASGKNTPRKGPRFGLQTVMIVGDDTNLAGGAPDPRQQFKGVQVKAPVTVAPGAFGAPVGAPPPSAGTAAYYPPPPAGGVPNMAPAAMAPPPPGVPAEDDLSQFA